MGVAVPRLASMKIKLFGFAAQTNGLIAPGALLTLSILSLNNVPDPFSGVKSFEKADMRRVLIGPGPGRTLPDTVQLEAPVSPAAATGGLEKVQTVSSKVKSPWKPIRFCPEVMVVVTTGSMITVVMGTELSKVSVGRVTVIDVPSGSAGAGAAGRGSGG